MPIKKTNVKIGRNLYKNRSTFYEKELINSEAVKKELIENITIRTFSGKLFYGDPISRSDLSDAIDLLTEKNENSIFWKLAEEYNNEKIVPVSLEELKEAREKALAKKTEIIGVN